MGKGSVNSAQQPDEKDRRQSKLPPVVSIYQNPDYVAGIVQQVFEAPLVTGLVVDADQVDASTKNANLAAGVEGGGKGSVPAVGALFAKIAGDATYASGAAITTTSRSSQSFVYSQSYYLGLIRHELRARNLLVELIDATSVQKMRVGDFVEFQAVFSTPPLASFIDVLTPDLVGAITEYRARKSGRDGIDFSDYEGMKAAAHEVELKATSSRDLAASVTRALQADFRQTSTREYYGAIEGLDDVTAIAICDAGKFLLEDEDRILDGSFTVLGKVTSLPKESTPVLERNKLLSNISPEAVDALLGAAKEQLESNTNSLPFGKKPIEALMQMQLNSRVPGRAFQVIPVAIFI